MRNNFQVTSDIHQKPFFDRASFAPTSQVDIPSVSGLAHLGPNLALPFSNGLQTLKLTTTLF